MTLIEYAEDEMKRAGLYDADADYGGLIPDAVMALVRAHSDQGHSGFSHALTLQIFNRVINFKPLTPIGATPDEWTEVSAKMWQNSRAPSVFSETAGKTWYDLDNLSRYMRVKRWWRGWLWEIGYQWRKHTGRLPKVGGGGRDGKA
jgi:hypothetical protein